MREQPKYRVAMVAACPFPSLRGSQVLIRELSEALAAEGHEVHVVTYPTAQHIVPVERISIHRAPKVLWTTRPFGWQKVVLDLMMLVVLLRVVRRKQIDVIHAHNLEGPVLAYLVRMVTGVPVVYHAHNALVDELPFYFRSALMRRLATRLGRFLDARVASWADYSIALSGRLAAFLAVRGAVGKVCVIPPAVTPGSNRERGNGSIGGESTIVYSGNIDRYQNLECLLAAFDRVCAAEPRARLSLVLHQGSHPRAVRRAEELGRRPGVSVQVVGTYAAVARELRKADVLVCPRTSWSGFPIKVLNYMAAGRPIVQSKGSAHSLEDGVSGLLYEDGDPGALAKALLRILRDPALADQLGAGARAALRESYVWPRVLPRILEIYRTVTAKPADLGGTGKNRETNTSIGASMAEMPQRLTRRIPSTQRRRVRAHLAVALLGALALTGCARKHAETVAPLPEIAAPVVPGSAQSTGQYTIKSGDQLRVKFLFHPELDVKVPVGPDGRVQVQGIGELEAAGKTAEELSADLEELSSSTLRDPEVTVIVAELGARMVYVMGEVRLPGAVQYREGMTPLQAIIDRGGFTEVAQLDSVLHLSPNGTSYDATRLDFTKEIQSNGPEIAQLGVYDIIHVPRTFIGDANAVVRLYIRGLLPTMPRIGIGFSP